MSWDRRNPDSEANRARAKKYSSREHVAARKQFTALVAAGMATCWRCSRRLLPGKWHVGHNDKGDHIMGPECVECNLKAAASKGAKIANAKRNNKPPFQRPTR